MPVCISIIITFSIPPSKSSLLFNPSAFSLHFVQNPESQCSKPCIFQNKSSRHKINLLLLYTLLLKMLEIFQKRLLNALLLFYTTSLRLLHSTHTTIIKLAHYYLSNFSVSFILTSAHPLPRTLPFHYPIPSPLLPAFFPPENS